MRREFKLGLVQMRVEGGERLRNLDRAAKWVAQAARAGVQVVVLPEALPWGWTHASRLADSEGIPEGRDSLFLSRLAIEHGIYLCSGLIEREGERIYNAAVLMDPQGRIRLHHRKLNELEIGQDLYAQGDRLGVAETPLATFGLMICADAFARGQTVSRTLGLMGASVILSPSAWAVPEDHDNTTDPYGQLWLDNYGPVARDYRLWIAGVSNVGRVDEGPWRGRRCIGCSLVVGPDGSEVLRGPYGEDAEALLCLDVTPDPRPARGDAWESWWADGHPQPAS